MFRVIAFTMTLFFSFSVWSDAKPILTVYTYSSFPSEWGPGREIKARFEKECQCVVHYISFGDGVTILNRLKLEGSKSRADVILGLDNNLVLAAKKANLVQPHHLKPFPNMQLSWWDNDFVPYDFAYFAFVYNKHRIPHPPKNFDELLSKTTPWCIVYSDPRTSTPGLGLVMWIQTIYGDNAPVIWRKLAQKTLTVTSGWTEAYNLMLHDEADLVLSYDTSPVAHMLNEHDFSYDYAPFEEGHYQQIEVAGIAKSSSNFVLAQRFLTFLGTPEVQRLLATRNIMHPVVKINLPSAFNQLKTVKKPLRLSAGTVESNRKKWISLWQNAVSQ